MDNYFEYRNEATGNEINWNLIMSKLYIGFLLCFKYLDTLIADLLGQYLIKREKIRFTGM